MKVSDNSLLEKFLFLVIEIRALTTTANFQV